MRFPNRVRAFPKALFLPSSFLSSLSPSSFSSSYTFRTAVMYPALSRSASTRRSRAAWNSVVRIDLSSPASSPSSPRSPTSPTTTAAATTRAIHSSRANHSPSSSAPTFMAAFQTLKPAPAPTSKSSSNTTINENNYNSSTKSKPLRMIMFGKPGAVRRPQSNHSPPQLIRLYNSFFPTQHLLNISRYYREREHSPNA